MILQHISKYLLKALSTSHHAGGGASSSTALEPMATDGANGAAGGGERNNNKKYRLHALHLAAKKNDVKNGEFLLSQMKVSPNITSKSGFTPMHIAAHYDNVEFGRLLLAAEGGGMCEINFRAKHQITPVHVASKWGKLNFLRFLVENGGDIYAKTKDQLTPVHCAARSGHLNCIQLLLEENYNLIEARTKNGLTPLHMTVQGNHLDCTKYLISMNRDGVNCLSNDSLTPLHIAAHYNFQDQCEVLLENGANCYVRASNGYTPVHIACKKKFYNILVLMMKYMNKPMVVEGDVEQPARVHLDGDAMQVAVEMGSIEVIRYLLENEASIKQEINGDEPVGERFLSGSSNERGETPLHVGVMTCNLEVIKVLLEAGREDTVNRGTVGDNQGPVFYAIRQLKRPVQRDSGSNDEEEGLVELMTEDSLAAEDQQKLTVVKYLLENGANLEQKTVRNHWTPFMYAVKLKLHYLVQYFIDQVIMIGI